MVEREAEEELHQEAAAQVYLPVRGTAAHPPIPPDFHLRTGLHAERNWLETRNKPQSTSIPVDFDPGSPGPEPNSKSGRLSLGEDQLSYTQAEPDQNSRSH